jgi:hypothetical protein
VWSSGTYGVGATLALQGDGNVVIYSANNKAVYASYWYFDHAVYTTPDANKYLYLVYYGHNHVIANNWGTATATGYSALSGVQWRDFGTQSACTVETEPIWEYYPARTLAPVPCAGPIPTARSSSRPMGTSSSTSMEEPDGTVVRAGGVPSLRSSPTETS